MLLSVTSREFATILAALRYWQANDRNAATKAPSMTLPATAANSSRWAMTKSTPFASN